MSGAFIAILIIVVGIALVAIVAGTSTDLLNTASVVDAIELSDPLIYSEQGYVTVQVKNNGNTNIAGVYATILLDDAAGGSASNCESGTDPALITNNLAAYLANAHVSEVSLNPGESITISGGMRDVGAISFDSDGNAQVGAVGVITSLACDGDPTNSNLEDRAEYILQINANSDGDPLSKTVQLRAK